MSSTYLFLCFLFVSLCCAQSPGSSPLAVGVRGSAIVGNVANYIYFVYPTEYLFNLVVPSSYAVGQVGFIPVVGIDYSSGIPGASFQVRWNGKYVSTGGFSSNLVPYVYNGLCLLVAPNDNLTIAIEATSGSFYASFSAWFNWVYYNTTTMKCYPHVQLAEVPIKY